MGARRSGFGRAQRWARAHRHGHHGVRRALCARAPVEAEGDRGSGRRRMKRITLRRPDDWHLHRRDGEALRAVLRFSAARFGRAIVMPNLKPPVTTTDLALAYRERILDMLPDESGFVPLMTLF